MSRRMEQAVFKTIVEMAYEMDYKEKEWVIGEVDKVRKQFMGKFPNYKGMPVYKENLDEKPNPRNPRKITVRWYTNITKHLTLTLDEVSIYVGSDVYTHDIKENYVLQPFIRLHVHAYIYNKSQPTNERIEGNYCIVENYKKDSERGPILETILSRYRSILVRCVRRISEKKEVMAM